MLKSLIEWFDRQLLDKGTPATVRSIFGIIGISLMLAAVPGVSSVKIGVLSAFVLISLISVLVLLRSRAKLLQESASYKELLSRYCEFIADHPKPPYRLSSWQQIASVHNNGDTDETVDIQVVTTRKAIYFLQFSFRADWSQPSKYRKKVNFEVHLLRDDGERVPDSEVTHTWLPNGALNLVYHLHAPVGVGTKLRLQVSWHWPGKCLPLMQRKTDMFTFNFTKAFPVDHVSYIVVLPPGYEACCSPVGFNDSDVRFSVRGRKNTDRYECMFEGVDLPMRRKIGMRLQLK